MRDISEVEIIAEIGVNHNGDVKKAFALIDEAVSAGANTVKFQTFKAENLVSRDAPKAEYQKRRTRSNETQLELLQQLQIPLKHWPRIIKHCEQCNVQFLSTAFDIESAELLRSLGQRRIKIPSGEINNLPYLRYLGSCCYPILLSTGMSNLSEIVQAVEILEKAGTNRTHITVLHCTSAYPTPPAEANLRAMSTIREALGVNVGYSDHTRGIEVSVGAVAIGATVIEKHITLDRRSSGPDHVASLNPKEFAAFVLAIRNISKAMGDGIKKPTSSEKLNMVATRKSIVASCVIRKGAILSEGNLCLKRPGNGISPLLWDNVVGQRATKDFQEDELIQI